MSGLEDLYQRLILDHSRHPRNAGALPARSASGVRVARGDNPVCGDRVVVSVVLDGDRIADVRFEGSGCAISVASASMMTEAIRGRTRAEADALRQQLERLVSGEPAADVERERLGDLVALGGVARFPVRRKCARLAWQTLRAALDAKAPLEGDPAPVSTE
jgi:nitrogen fixation NifU-like protein